MLLTMHVNQNYYTDCEQERCNLNILPVQMDSPSSIFDNSCNLLNAVLYCEQFIMLVAIPQHQLQLRCRETESCYNDSVNLNVYLNCLTCYDLQCSTNNNYLQPTYDVDQCYRQGNIIICCRHSWLGQYIYIYIYCPVVLQQLSCTRTCAWVVNQSLVGYKPVNMVEDA